MRSQSDGGLSAMTQVKVLSPEIVIVALGQGFRILEASTAASAKGEHVGGVSGNSRAIIRFYRRVVRMTRKWLNRRSQRKRFYWKGFNEYLKHYPLPRPRIVHNFYALSPVK